MSWFSLRIFIFHWLLLFQLLHGTGTGLFLRLTLHIDFSAVILKGVQLANTRKKPGLSMGLDLRNENFIDLAIRATRLGTAAERV